MNEIMINELVNGLLKVYSDVLVQVVLYGSVAKNTATVESDIDVAIMLNTNNSKDYENELLEFIVDMNLKYNKVFSIIDIELLEFQKWENVLPFFKNVKEEGIVLWKVA
ncbi:MAG: nucleotidyltransferase domain-containing protein [Anaerocolumna sp.]